MGSMTTAATTKNAAHHLQQSVGFLEDLSALDLPDGFDQLTIKLVLEMTTASAEYLTSLAEAIDAGTT